MAQPKEPPLSIRLGAERLARVEAYATKHSLSRHLALLVLIDRALAGETFSAASVESMVATAKAAEAAGIPIKAKAPQPFKSRLKGEWKAP